MIDINRTTAKQAPEKSAPEISKPKTPFHSQDSSEAEWIKAKIKSNKEYLLKCTSKTLYKKVEKDTLYLENEILPIIQAKTNLFYNELTKKFIGYLNSAIENGCNSMTMYLPINDNYIENPKTGIANCRQNKKAGEAGAVDIFLEIINMDGNEAPFTTILLQNTAV